MIFFFFNVHELFILFFWLGGGTLPIMVALADITNAIAVYTVSIRNHFGLTLCKVFVSSTRMDERGGKQNSRSSEGMVSRSRSVKFVWVHILFF